MLKIVPDPPLPNPSLEDTILRATEYALCAQAVTHQAMQIVPKSPAAAMMLASVHEIEMLLQLLDAALVQAQQLTPQTQH